MNTLLSRLEALTAPSREIDAELFALSGTVNEDHCREWCTMDGRKDLVRKRYLLAWAPRYTESVDAARTMIPKDFFIKLDLCGRSDKQTGLMRYTYEVEFRDRDVCGIVVAANPAIALLIAITRI